MRRLGAAGGGGWGAARAGTQCPWAGTCLRLPAEGPALEAEARIREAASSEASPCHLELIAAGGSPYGFLDWSLEAPRLKKVTV